MISSLVHNTLHLSRSSTFQQTLSVLTGYLIETPPKIRPSHNPTLLRSTSSNMSAPKAGRQSPERQTDSQMKEPASGNIGAAASETKAKEDSDDFLNKLPSNPEGPMEGAAHEKVSKEGRGDV